MPRENISVWCCILFFLVIFSPATPAAEEQPDTPGIAPSHGIVLKDQQARPSWMQLWEKARESARNSDDRKAAEFYRQLFMEKPQIEEALREYGLILMNLGQWKEAGTVVQQLLEFNPDSLEYLLYAGRVALIQQRYERAVHYLGQVYTLSPDGPGSMEALRGQISALRQLGREELAYPLMEQLYLRIPHEKHFLQDLARSSLKLGYRDKAETFYRTLLTEFEGADVDYLNSEPLFTAVNDDEMSVRCWHGYLKYHPFYLPFHIKLSEFYLQSGQDKKALPHLLVRIAHGDNSPHIFLATAKIYTYQEGRPDKALHYYDEYQKRNPGDTGVVPEIKRIQAVLADDLLVIVENDGAWPLWRDLAKVIPDRLAVYYSMAEKLTSLRKEKELLEVLEIINHHNPGDSRVLFQLAQLYFSGGKMSKCTAALDSLPDEARTGKEYFFLRAGVEEQRGNSPAALSYYKTYLDESPKDYEVALQSMQLAGDLGLIDELHFLYSLLPEKEEDESLFCRGAILYGQLLAENHLTSSARQFYRQLLARGDLSKDNILLVKRRIIDTLQSESDYFGAEQLLRKLLISENGSNEIVTELIDNSLLEGDWDGAWKWYEFGVETVRDPSRSDEERAYELFTRKIEILERSGQGGVAAEIVEDSLLRDDSVCLQGLSQCQELKTRLAEIYFTIEKYREASTLLESIVVEFGATPALHVLDELILAELPPEEDDAPVLARGIEQSISLIDRIQLHEQYKSYGSGLQLSSEYLRQQPTVIRARVLHGRLLMLSGDDFAALEVFRQLAAEYPEEFSFQQNFTDLLFKVAEFEDLIEELAPDWKPAPGGGGLLRLRNVPEAVQVLGDREKLLLARTFWAVRRWNDALLLYDSLQQSPVDHEFSKRLALANVSLVLPPPKRTFWHRITFTEPAEPDRLSVVMSPHFTGEHLHEPAVSIASDLYASYRWQQIVSRELPVRLAMKDGNYYQAMKEYQKLLDRDSSTESLFDLAGVYSRLGFSGKEAALYEIIREESPGYPDLDEAIQRNSLKRQPRVSLGGHAAKKTGREDYFDNIERGGGLQGWFMPSLKHEFSLDLQRIYNKSDEVEQTLWRNRAHVELKWSPMYDLDFLAGIGADRPDDDHGTTLLYNLRANGRIGDMLRGYCRVSQDVIDDTVEALATGIKGKEYETGFSLDFLPRLFGGYEYRFTEYSDGNHQNRYELWSSYILKSEPQLLQLRYGYEYSHNSKTNRGRDYSFTSGFAPDDHPYWSPKEYWQHLFTVSFEHQLAEDVLGRSAPSYYSLEYTFGYENEGYDNHQFKGQIFLEMSRHFLLNGAFDYTHGAEYEEQDYLLSLIYRW